MKEQIKAYILEHLIEDDIDLTFSTELYSSGLISSMGHLKFISYLERTFDISIPVNDINLENFDTIEQMSEFIEENCE